MTASIATFPFNPAGKMTKKEYIAHMKQVWRRMGMVKATEQVVVKREVIRREAVEEAVKVIEDAKATAPAFVPVSASPMLVERKRVSRIVNRPNRINAAVHKPRELIIGALPQKPHLRDIVRVVADYYDTTTIDIMSESHKPEHVAARHACFYISRKVCEKSFMAIGRDFKRDHSTIVSAVTRMEKRIASDREFDEAFQVIVQAVLATAIAKSDSPFCYWGA